MIEYERDSDGIERKYITHNGVKFDVTPYSWNIGASCRVLENIATRHHRELCRLRKRIDLYAIVLGTLIGVCLTWLVVKA